MRKFHTPNVDKKRTRLNVVLKEECIEQTYHDLFDQALLQYNQKQKRADRKINDYYKHILHSKKEKAFHELVIQVGNMNDNHQDFNSILEEYYRGFEERNPQMRVVAAVIHNDEKTPHLHLDYVPFITGQKRGLGTKVANNRAIAQMGYEDFEHWRNSEMEVLEQILLQHGLKRTVMNSSDRHRTVQGYKTEQRIIESHINTLESKKVELPTPTIKKTLTGAEMVKKSDYDELANNYRVAEEQISNYQAQISVLRKENNKHEQNLAEIKNKPYVALNKALQEEVDDSVKCINQVYDDIMNKYEPKENYDKVLQAYNFEHRHRKELAKQVEYYRSDYEKYKTKYLDLKQKYEPEPTSIRERIALAKQKKVKTYEQLERENKELRNEIANMKEQFKAFFTEVQSFITNITNRIYELVFDAEETKEIINDTIIDSFSNADKMQDMLDDVIEDNGFERESNGFER